MKVGIDLIGIGLSDFRRGRVQELQVKKVKVKELQNLFVDEKALSLRINEIKLGEYKRGKKKNNWDQLA